MNSLKKIYLINLFLFCPLFLIIGIYLIYQDSNNLWLKIIILLLAIYILLLSIYKVYFVIKKIKLKKVMDYDTGFLMVLIGIISLVFTIYKLNELSYLKLAS